METLKITSAQNSIIKKFKVFSRRKTPLLVCLDGTHLHQEYFKVNQKKPIHTLVSSRFIAHPDFQDFKNKTDFIEVPDDLMAKISPTKSPAGLLSIVEKPKEILATNQNLVVVLENIQNPGNVGTMLRTSLAMGVNQVLLLGDTTDIWSEKCLRAGMGAQFYVPVKKIQNLKTWKESFTGKLISTTLNGENLWSHSLPAPVAFIFGNEGQGVSLSSQKVCDQSIKIPMHSKAESLNVASSLAILTHEWTRQQNT